MLYMPREEGQGLVEYALILALVALVVIVMVTIYGPAVGNLFSNVIRRVRGGNKTGLELRRREINSFVQHSVKKFGESHAVAFHSVG